jgi:nitrite reductase/ring-hydroxylating ferredoxin subunit
MRTRLVVAKSVELLEGEPRLVVHEGVPYCVIKTDGRVNAFVAVCPHKDLAMVPLRTKHGRIVCPHHGAMFDATSGDVADDNGKDVPHGLPRVDVTIDDDGNVCIEARRRHRKLIEKKERQRVIRHQSPRAMSPRAAPST